MYLSKDFALRYSQTALETVFGGALPTQPIGIYWGFQADILPHRSRPGSQKVRERWAQALECQDRATVLRQAPQMKSPESAIVEDRACLHDSNEDWHRYTHCFCVAIILGSFLLISFLKIFYYIYYSSSGIMYLFSSLDWQYSWTQNIGYPVRVKPSHLKPCTWKDRCSLRCPKRDSSGRHRAQQILRGTQHRKELTEVLSSSTEKS